jgi:hypothetical protein
MDGFSIRPMDHGNLKGPTPISRLRRIPSATSRTIEKNSVRRAKTMQEVEVYSVINAEGFMRLVAAFYRPGFITSRNNSHHRFRCPCRRQSTQSHRQQNLNSGFRNRLDRHGRPLLEGRLFWLKRSGPHSGHNAKSEPEGFFIKSLERKAPRRETNYAEFIRNQRQGRRDNRRKQRDW